MEKVLVINGNPKHNSLCQALAESYKQGVESTGTEVDISHISNIGFQINLNEGYEKTQNLEDDLKKLQDSIMCSSHLVFVSPIWWGTMPAKLKGLIDRTFLPDFAFKYVKGKTFPEKLLKGKTARIITTMDSPSWYYQYILGDPIVKTLNKPTLALCGIKLLSVSRFGPIKGSTSKKINNWILKAKKAGIKDSEKLNK